MAILTTGDGVQVEYLCEGSGSHDILYLHWLGGEAGMWRQVVDALPKGFRHIALSFRGHGGSQSAPCAFTNECAVADALAVAENVGSRSLILVGHSFGGKVALQVAARAPDLVRGLVLLAPVGPGKVEIDPASVREVLATAADPRAVREAFRGFFKVWPTQELDHALLQLSRTPAWALAAVCEAGLFTDRGHAVGTIARPTMVLQGEADPLYGPDYQSRSVAPFVPAAEFVTVGCGHGMFLERPAEVGAAIRRFLSSTCT